MFRKLIVLLIILLAGIVWWRWPTDRSQREFVQFRLKDEEYTAVVARQPAEIQLGLSGRESLGADAMLFLLSSPQRATFWMFEMHFPLDFVWLANNKVIDRHENIQPPAIGTPREQIVTVQPTSPAEGVLELPAGFIARHQIELGDEFALTGQFFRKLW